LLSEMSAKKPDLLQHAIAFLLGKAIGLSKDDDPVAKAKQAVTNIMRNMDLQKPPSKEGQSFYDSCRKGIEKCCQWMKDNPDKVKNVSYAWLAASIGAVLYEAWGLWCIDTEAAAAEQYAVELQRIRNDFVVPCQQFVNTIVQANQPPDFQSYQWRLQYAAFRANADSATAAINDLLGRLETAQERAQKEKESAETRSTVYLGLTVVGVVATGGAYAAYGLGRTAACFALGSAGFGVASYMAWCASDNCRMLIARLREIRGHTVEAQNEIRRMRQLVEVARNIDQLVP
jgi:hypothetical protein